MWLHKSIVTDILQPKPRPRGDVQDNQTALCLPVVRSTERLAQSRDRYACLDADMRTLASRSIAYPCGSDIPSNTKLPRLA